MPSETEVLLPSLAPDNLVPSEQVPAVTPGLKIGQMNPHEFHVVYGGARARGKSEEESIQEVLNQRAMLEPAKKTASLLPKDADLVEFNNLREEDLTPEERLVFDTRVAGGQTAEEALADLETNRLFNNAPITGGPAGGGAGTPGGPPAPSAGDPNDPDGNDPVHPNQPPPRRSGSLADALRNRRPPPPEPPAPPTPPAGEQPGSNNELTQVLKLLLERLSGGDGGPDADRGISSEKITKILANPARDEDRDEIVVALKNPYYSIGQADQLQLVEGELWEVAFTETQQGLMPFKIPATPEGKIKYVRDALAEQETLTIESDAIVQTRVQRAQMLTTALRGEKYQRKLQEALLADPDNEDIKRNLELGDELHQEFIARSLFHQIYLRFEHAESVKAAGALFRQFTGENLNSLFKIPEVGMMFNLLDRYYDKYLFVNPREIDKMRLSFLGMLAQRVEQGDSVIPDQTEEERNNWYNETANNIQNDPELRERLEKQYGWTFRLGERLWHATGRAAIHDVLKEKDPHALYPDADPDVIIPPDAGEVTFASSRQPKGSGYFRRLFQMPNYVKAIKKSMLGREKLIEGVETDGGDFLGKSLLKAVEKYWRNSYRNRFLIQNGVDTTNTPREWEARADIYALENAWPDAQRVLGIPMELVRDNNGKPDKWKWQETVVQGAGGSVTKFYDFSKLKWDEIDFNSLYTEIAPMDDWTWTNLEYADDFRVALVAPGEPGVYLRNPTAKGLLELAGKSKGERHYDIGEILVENFVEWAAGQISQDTGAPTYTDEELRVIIAQASGHLRGGGNEVPLFDPKRYGVVYAKSMAKARRVRAAAEAENRRLRAEETNARNERLRTGMGTEDDVVVSQLPNPTAEVTKKFATGFAIGAIKGLFGIK